MFSFLPLMNNSVTIRLSFLLLSISTIVSLKTINILRFLFGLCSSIFLCISSMSFDYWIKALESFKCFKLVLSLLLISNWYFASYGSLAYKYYFSWSRASNYQYSKRMVRKFAPLWIMFFYVFFCNIINVKHFSIVLL